MPSPDKLDPLALADIVGHIYEAAVDARQWGDFVDLIERIYPGSRITVFGHENGRPSEGLSVNKNFPEDALRDYINYYVTNSPFVERVGQIPLGRPTRSETVVSDADLMKTEHYHDFVKPNQLGHYATGLLLERGRGFMTAFSIADHKNDEERRLHQFRLLEVLSPHLLRAVKLRRALIEQNAVAGASQAAFDRWTHAAFVLASNGRVLVQNAAANTLLRRNEGLWLSREGYIRSVDEGRTRLLEAAIAKCAAIACSLNTACDEGDLPGVPLSRPSSEPPLHAMVWPLPFLNAHPQFGTTQGSVLVMIVDPAQMQRVPVRWLAKQFGLSPAEEKLTEAIVNGVTLSETAAQLGIRLSTAQTRLKAIQTKTGCHRQVDLVRLAMSLPTMRRG